MKVADGKEDAWLKLARETWKPMHALRVKNGSIRSWAAIAQAMPGDESDEPVVGTVTTFRGWPDPTKTDWTALYKQAHPQGNIDATMQQNGRCSEDRSVRDWQVLDQTEPAPAGTK